ncbi:hypothetical protein GF337_09575 [candidate division KSB1 bacterium]|nr:hypothetical protein [candidate division KSB1 bacterium]
MTDMFLNKKIVFLFLLFIFLWHGLSAPLNSKQPAQKLFSFGIMADIQYADKDTKGKRYYRQSIENLKKCVSDLNKQELAFTIQLGDIIDGNETAEQTAIDVKQVMDEYNQLIMPAYHAIGNHCMRAGAGILKEQLGLEKFYYDFKAPESEKWRFIVLDGNDAGYGVLGENQLKWLGSRLDVARQQNELVTVFNHFPLVEAAAAKHRMKEPKPVVDLIENSDCVVAYVAGHDHAGGYAFHKGIHHLTLHGMVEAPVENAYAIVDVFPDKLVIHGFGKELSRELVLPE